MKAAKGQARTAKKSRGQGDTSLGATLTTARVRARRGLAEAWGQGNNMGARHTTDDGGGRGQALHSVWEMNDLQGFLYQAEQQAKDFAAERNTRVTQGGVTHVAQDDKMQPLADGENSRWYTLSERLPIPMRPPWTHEMRKIQVEEQERLAFNEWRRQLAGIEEREGVLMTPFERNLEVWRQLWRVVERSDVVMMIVDARNPLALRCKAVERYTEKAGKKFVLLLNKAELLTERQRRSWARHFQREDVLAIFFSAAASRADQERLEGRDVTRGRVGQEPAEPVDRVAEDHAALREEEEFFAEEEEELEDEPSEAPSRAARPTKKPRRNQQKLKGAPPVQDVPHWAQQEQPSRRGVKRDPEPAAPPLPEEEERTERVQMVQKAGGLAAVHQVHKSNPARIYTPDELVDYALLHRSDLALEGSPVTMGFIGYPNVGKSSTINALWQSKRVNVSATPGKTKHLQTLKLEHERRVMLCDCPGLVFPSFASTRDHMVVDGVLPISQLRDAIQTMQIVARRVPSHVFELLYTIDLDVKQEDSPTIAHQIANAYARARGYMTDHNKPNTNRAARDILKDYVDGKLVYVWPPPNPEDISEVSSDSESDEEGEEYEEEEEGEEVEEKEDGEDRGLIPPGHVDPQDWEVVRRAVGAVDSDDEIEVKKETHEDAKFNKENANMGDIYDKVQRKWAEKKRKARVAREIDERGVRRDEFGNVIVEVSDDEVDVVEVDEAAVPQRNMTKRQRRKMEQAAARGRVGLDRHQRQAVRGAAGYQGLFTA